LRGIFSNPDIVDILTDFSQDNILLDAELHVQITDFRLTRHSEVTETAARALRHSFAAPELFGYNESEFSDSDDSTARTQESDIYAFGCLYYEVSDNRYSSSLQNHGLHRFITIPFLSREHQPCTSYGPSPKANVLLD